MRLKTPLDLADAQALGRVASLASSVMCTLRTPARGHYTSENQLRKWLSEDGIAYTSQDLSPALALLEATKRIVRPEVKSNNPRPGRLATGADIWTEMAASEGGVPEAVEVPEDPPVDTTHVAVDVAVGAPEDAVEAAVEAAEDTAEDAAEGAEPVPDESTDGQRIFALAKAVVSALTSGNGRSNPCEEDELRSRLAQDGMSYNPSDLPAALSLLEGNGEAGYDVGALPGLPYRVLPPVPDSWQGPTQRQPTAPRLFQLKYLRPY